MPGLGLNDLGEAELFQSAADIRAGDPAGSQGLHSLFSHGLRLLIKRQVRHRDIDQMIAEIEHEVISAIQQQDRFSHEAVVRLVRSIMSRKISQALASPQVQVLDGIIVRGSHDAFDQDDHHLIETLAESAADS